MIVIVDPVPYDIVIRSKILCDSFDCELSEKLAIHNLATKTRPMVYKIILYSGKFSYISYESSVCENKNYKN